MQNFHDFHRGEIYYAYLGPSFGHEQGGLRPVLILQNDVGNFYSPTLIVVPITTHIYKKSSQPTHVTLPDIDGLSKPSTFLLESIMTIDKRRIRTYVGKLTDNQMELVVRALRISLHIDEDALLPIEVEAP